VHIIAVEFNFHLCIVLVLKKHGAREKRGLVAIAVRIVGFFVHQILKALLNAIRGFGADLFDPSGARVGYYRPTARFVRLEACRGMRSKGLL